MKLLRVEWKGKGLHQRQEQEDSNSSLFYKVIGNFNSYYHPEPERDSGLYNFWRCKEEYKFAFGNTRQFLRWIYKPSWRQEMADLGGELLVIEVDQDYYIREDQAVYHQDKVISVKSFPINSFDDPLLEQEINKYLSA